MLFSDLHAKLLENERKACTSDGRKFNKRSRVRMDREVEVINNFMSKSRKKKTHRKGMFRGMFSEEDLQFEAEENDRARLERLEKSESVKKHESFSEEGGASFHKDTK